MNNKMAINTCLSTIESKNQADQNQSNIYIYSIDI